MKKWKMIKASFKKTEEEQDKEDSIDLTKPDPKKRLNSKYNSKEAFDAYDTDFKKRCFKG